MTTEPPAFLGEEPGADEPAAVQQASAPVLRHRSLGEPEAVYEYHDANGAVVLLVARFAGKKFLQRDPRQPDGKWGLLEDTPRPLYRLPQLLAHFRSDSRDSVYVVEGEKDVHAIEAAGGVATCNPMGAGKFTPEQAEQLAAARTITIVVDRDGREKAHSETGLTPGEQQARTIIDLLGSVGAPGHIELVQARHGKDAHDHLAAGGTLTDFEPFAWPSNDVPKPEVASEATTHLRVVTLDTFLGMTDTHAPALLGSDDEAILTVGGFLLMAGEGGASKTTLTLDALIHMAAGADWLGISVPRPVRILLIENEGPRPRFRQKLDEKVDAWDGADVSPNMLVSAEPWGRFSFADEGLRNELRAVCREQRVDMVFADPVDSLGIQGVGAPDETRAFMENLKLLGLFDPDEPLAFWLLHHFNKSQAKSVLAQLSGAWGGHPDAVLGVSQAGDHRTKLMWAKLRWATPPKDEPEWLLKWTDGKSFERIETGDNAPLVADEELVERISGLLLKAGPAGLSLSAIRTEKDAQGARIVRGDNNRIGRLVREHFHNVGTEDRPKWSMQALPQQQALEGEQ